MRTDLVKMTILGSILTKEKQPKMRIFEKLKKKVKSDPP